MSVRFYLNGSPVTLDDPDPDLLLIDYLRSPDLKLAGAKKGCGQGGCGACTVILSEWVANQNKVQHRSINSCLRPVCSLNGFSVTTVEGTGGAVRLPPKSPVQSLASSRVAASFDAQVTPQLQSAHQKMTDYRENADTEGKQRKESGSIGVTEPVEIDPKINPIAYRLAVNNGSQCGYCSTGFVMNMSAFLANNPEPTKKEIEQAFDGNICRCTGYRPILTAMKTFAKDWSADDEANRQSLKLDDLVKAQPVNDTVTIPIAGEARSVPTPTDIFGERQVWLTPSTVTDLVEIYKNYGHQGIYLLHANTAFGIYRDDFLSCSVLVNIQQLSEIYGLEHNQQTLLIGAGTTYTALFDYLESMAPSTLSSLEALHFMVHRTGGTIIRNAATIGGNSMLVLKHIAGGTGAPFPSDLFTVLAALDTKIDYVDLASGESCQMPLTDLIARCHADQSYADQILLTRYQVPILSAGSFIQAQKVALRDINAHSIVNMTSVIEVNEDQTITSAKLVYGAIAPFPWRAEKTETAMIGDCLTLDNFTKLASILCREVQSQLDHWAARMKEVEYEGFTDAYRVDLATGFLYKAILTALVQSAPERVPEKIRSGADVKWGNWPVSDGTQYSKVQAYKAPVSESYIKLMSLYQTSGQVRYTHEIEVPPTTLNASFVQSKRALANFSFKNPETGESPITAEKLSDYLQTRSSNFKRLITSNDIPAHGLKKIGMGSDQPVFADRLVSYVGQSIALVIGVDEFKTSEFADFVSEHCIEYSPVEWSPEWVDPVLDIDDAISRGSIFPDYPKSAPFVSHIWKIIRNHSNFDWSAKPINPLDKKITTRRETIDGGECLVVEATQVSGGQVHFYLETQACVAIPGEGETMRFHPSSQSPTEMHTTAAAVLGMAQNQVGVQIHQVGGGYGGKTEQAKFIIAAAAVAANATQKPVRLVMPRDNDTSLIGKRHPYYGKYQIAIDDGSVNTEHKGTIRGVDLTMYGDGGAFYDCSFIVANCIQTRIDGSYLVPNFRSTIDVCRTNTAPNTAFRSFGYIQGTIIAENALDDAAAAIDMCPEKVREKNLYQRGDVTPFGQSLSDCYIRDVWAYLKKKSDFKERQAAVYDYNKNNKWRKRGICMLPVKYGSGYNLVQLEQASALVSIYSADGTVVINQGGVDMGQGMVTKIEQIASYILNVPMDKIRINLPDTEVIPNPTSTGGSTGTAYNGLAVKKTCERVRARLIEFAMQIRDENGDAWCSDHGIDFWNHPELGWATEVEIDGQTRLIWQNLISLANTKRISLIEAFNAEAPGGEAPMPVLAFKTLEQSQDEAIPGIEVAAKLIPGGYDSFCGFTYSAACTEIELDVLTGEVKILRADLVYDMGWSINPALDIGQVEGAFIQGVGYVMTEKLVFEPDGDEQGRLNTVNTWRYKPPAITNIPLEFNVYLFPRDKSDVPENPNELLSSKEVGEPPLVLAASVFFAIKAAIRSSRCERKLERLFKFDAPATVQEVKAALDVKF